MGGPKDPPLDIRGLIYYLISHGPVKVISIVTILQGQLSSPGLATSNRDNSFKMGGVGQHCHMKGLHPTIIQINRVGLKS